MSSEDLFANSEDVDNPAAMETDDKTDDDSEIMKDKVGEDGVEEVDAVESGDNDDVENESPGVLLDRSNIEDTEEAEANTGSPGKEEVTKLFRFPQGRIKSIMKLDPDVGMVNGEAIFLVNKAVEEFIRCLAAESYHYTTSSKKKTIMKEHVMTAIESIDELAFLDGAMDD